MTLTEQILTDRPATHTTSDGITIWLDWDRRYSRGSHVEQGLVIRADNHLISTSSRPVGPTVHWEGRYPGTTARIDGVPDDHIDAAIALVVNAVRTDLAYRHCQQVHRDRVLQLLTDVANRYATTPPGWRRHEVSEERRSLIARAISAGILTREEIAAAAQVQMLTVEVVAESEAAQREPSPHYVGTDWMARLLGVTDATLRAYRSRGLIPAPDIEIGGHPAWELDRASAIARSRPGQGARSDRRR